MAADSCPNAAFRTGPSASLPDCRAYEMVTPLDKADSNDMFTGSFRTNPNDQSNASGFARADGSDVLLDAIRSGPTPTAGTNSDFRFSRTASGWAMTPIEPADGGFTDYTLGSDEGIFSPGLGDVALLAAPSSLGSISTQASVVTGPTGGPYSTIVGPEPTVTPYNGLVSQATGASADFTHVVLDSRDHSLAPGASGQVNGSWAVYEWFGGRLRLVNVTTGGGLTNPCGAMVGGGPADGFSHNAVSRDGSKIFFVSPDPVASAPGDPNCGQPQHLYVREGGTTTVDVSAPNPGVVDPNGFQPVQFLGASADGTKVFFLTATELTSDDTTHDPELYEYDLESNTLTRVSRGSSGTADANVKWGIVSDDGSTVYFAAAGQLTPDAPATSGTSTFNVYRYDTATGSTRYIATINNFDGERAQTAFGGFVGGSVLLNWYTTADGRFLVFQSSADITGYLPQPGNPSSQYEELYRYDSADGSVRCVSCLAIGTAAAGQGDGAQFTRAGSPIQTPDTPTPRAITDEGNRVFFDTPDALVPQDTNGNLDVYEWQKAGTGSCPAGADQDGSGGCRFLISSGQDPLNSYFMGASADGQDVFIGTHSQLVPSDTDFAGDLYDARIGGGFPVPASPPPCDGQDCRGTLAGSPPLPVITTLTAGPGNLAAGAPPAKLRVLRALVRGTSLRLLVNVSGGGRISVAGAGVRPAVRGVGGAGTVTVSVALTRRSRRALRQGRWLRLKLRVVYRPDGGSASAVRVGVTVKPAPRGSRPGRARITLGPATRYGG